MIETKFGLPSKEQQSVDTLQTKIDKTQSTFNLDIPSSFSKEYEFGNIYGKLTSELSNLRNEINNMKTDREQKGFGKGKMVRNYNHIHTDTFGEQDEQLHVYSRKHREMKHESTDYDNDSLYNQIKTDAVENNFRAALASDSEEEDMNYNFLGTDEIKQDLNYLYTCSENQSPNQNAGYKRISYRESDKKNALVDVGNTMNSDRNYGASENTGKIAHLIGC